MPRPHFMRYITFSYLFNYFGDKVDLCDKMVTRGDTMQAEIKHNNYAVITKATFDKSKNRKKHREEIVSNLEKKMNKVLPNKVNLLYRNVLILWDNIPREDYFRDVFGYTKQDLLIRFCREIKNSKDEMRIYIESPLVFTDSKNPNMGEVLVTTLLIWRESKTIPLFLQDNFLCNGYIENDFSKMKAQIMPRINLQIKQMGIDKLGKDAVSTMQAALMSQEESKLLEESRKNSDEYFTKFFTSVSNLLKYFNVKETKQNKNSYIDLYLSWQMDKQTVEYCCEKLQIERQTWYRYADTFEKSPVYEEICNIYYHKLIKFPKKGRVPDTILLLAQYKKDNPLKENIVSMATPNVSGCYYTFDGINSIVDVTRCIETCKKRVEILKHKGEYRLRLKELGITEDISTDIYTENDTQYLFDKYLEQNGRNPDGTLKGTKS